jgi:membrane protease YdiL (CAAX protease family)
MSTNTPTLLSRWIGTATGIFGLIAALFTAGLTAQQFDRSETVREFNDVNASAWQSGAKENIARIEGRYVIVPRGNLRVRACVATGQIADMSMRVTDVVSGTSIAIVPVTGASSMSSRCLSATWQNMQPHTVTLSLVSTHTPPPHIHVTIRTGKALRLIDFLPVLLLLLSITLIVFPASESRAETERLPLPPPETSPAMMRGAWGVAWALGGFLAVNLAAAAVAGGSLSGAAMFRSLVVQQILFVAISAAILGAFTSSHPRFALEMQRPGQRWPTYAAVSACVLIALAITVSASLHDAGDSPIAKMIEAMPTRYVIAFGAFCAPLPEELFFRAVLGRVSAGLTHSQRPIHAILWPSMVFALAHAAQLNGALAGIIPIAAVALVNGWLRWRFGGILVPWIVHTVYNAAMAISVLA